MSSEFKWYVLKVISGKEQAIGAEIEKMILEDSVNRCVEKSYVPMQDVIKIRRGKKVVEKKSIYSGYVLIHMISDRSVSANIRNIDGALGFIGGDKPIPLTEGDVKKMIESSEKVANSVNDKVVYEVGQLVKIIDGSFESFVGEIEYVDFERSRLRVMVTIFGRPTPVDLDWDQVDIDINNNE